MLRIILGAIIGFVVWSVLWGGSDEIFKVISPDWYGKNLSDFERAIETKESYTVNTAILMMSLIRSVIISIIAGFTAARIAQENTRSTLGLGILLLAFGIFVQSIYWNYMPLWYHTAFLLLLIPMTIFGGKLQPQPAI